MKELPAPEYLPPHTQPGHANSSSTLILTIAFALRAKDFKAPTPQQLASPKAARYAPAVTNRRLYLILFIARPLGCFFLSCLATLGVCPRTLPARARDPWTLPASQKHSNSQLFCVIKLCGVVKDISAGHPTRTGLKYQARSNVISRSVCAPMVTNNALGKSRSYCFPWRAACLERALESREGLLHVTVPLNYVTWRPHGGQAHRCIAVRPQAHTAGDGLAIIAEGLEAAGKASHKGAWSCRGMHLGC